LPPCQATGNGLITGGFEGYGRPSSIHWLTLYLQTP
jgi:hypothetical protein